VVGSYKTSLARILLYLLIAAASFAIIVPVVVAQDTKLAQTENGSEIKPADVIELTGPQVESGGDDVKEGLCLLVEAAARTNNLPLEFFARVIWQESHFQSQAVGPLTHTGQRALGIAQFMPGTAKERGLLDPFNPVLALPKAAEFLAELRSQFGNLGLAAAAYNAGPRRVQEWLAGTGGMPSETRNYVLAVTGRGLETWTGGKSDESQEREAKATSCRELVALLRREPNRFVSQLEQSVAVAAAKPWGVQIATGFNRDQALTMYSRAVDDLKAVVSREGDPNLQPILFHVRATKSFYQVRIGTNTRREATSLCNRIRLAHGACLVKRTGA
jgi:hypothetical protein